MSDSLLIIWIFHIVVGKSEVDCMNITIRQIFSKHVAVVLRHRLLVASFIGTFIFIEKSDRRRYLQSQQ